MNSRLSTIILCLSLLIIPQVNAQVFFSKDTVYQFFNDSISIKNSSATIATLDSMTVLGKDSIDFDSTFFIFRNRQSIAYLYQIRPYISSMPFSIPPNDSITLKSFRFFGMYRLDPPYQTNDSVTIPLVFHFSTNNDTLVFKGDYSQVTTSSIRSPFVRRNLTNSSLNHCMFDLRGRRLSETTRNQNSGMYFNVFKAYNGETRIIRNINIR